MSLSSVFCMLAVTLAGQTTPPAGDAPATPPTRIGAPYLLDVCAVSGERIPPDGGVVSILDGTEARGQKGREVRFCCSRCRTAFEKEPRKYIAKIDELMIADQMPRYPASATCPVMPEETMPDPHGPEARDCKVMVWNNRMVRLCCTKCVFMFRADPAKYIAVLDQVVIEEAKKAGRQKTCVVNGRDLPASANWFVIGDRAVATCCRGCQPRAMARPRVMVAKLDDAG